jgi:ABC-type glycerol-3-phosphate transport system permease component
MHRVAQLTRLIAFVLLLAGAITMLVPFVWMFDTSIKAPGEIFLYPPRWIPSEWRWQNYSEALTVLPFGRWFFNTVYITVVASLGQVLSASLVGYAFARLRAPGRDFLFMVVIGTMLLPDQVTMVPVFLIFRGLNWIDTWNPLIVPAWLGGGAFFIFLCRQFFMTIPLELDDAAKIDGCGALRIFWQIILPLSRPAIATLAVLSFLANWNDFLWPIYVLLSSDTYTLQPGLSVLRGAYSTHYGVVMAGAVIAAVPVLILFSVAQRHIVDSVATAGLKG